MMMTTMMMMMMPLSYSLQRTFDSLFSAHKLHQKAQLEVRLDGRCYVFICRRK